MHTVAVGAAAGKKVFIVRPFEAPTSKTKDTRLTGDITMEVATTSQRQCKTTQPQRCNDYVGVSENICGAWSSVPQ